MTIISNNCAASRLYKMSNMTYNHPFFWCGSDFWDSSYTNWFLNFYDWNYQNVEFEYAETYCMHTKKRQRTCLVKIDNKTKTYYMHYMFDKQKHYDELSYYDPDILNYCKTKYFTRIGRMKKEKLYFIIDMYESHLKLGCQFPFLSVPDQDLMKLCEYDNVYCYTSNLPFDEHVRDCFKSKNLIIINEKKLYDSTSYVAEHFAKNFLNKIS